MSGQSSSTRSAFALPLRLSLPTSISTSFLPRSLRSFLSSIFIPIPSPTATSSTTSSYLSPTAAFFYALPRVLLIVSAVCLLWRIVEEPTDCSLLPAVRLQGACGYSDVELKRILAMEHGYTRGSPRYYFLGRWMHYITLNYELTMAKPNPKKDNLAVPPCVLVSVEGEVPCLTGTSCIIPFYLRPHTSDSMVLRVHFENSPTPFSVLRRETKQKRFTAVLDGGANIGITTTVLALMFPHARIVAVESSEENYRMLRLNTFALPNVVAFRAALWNKLNEPLSVHMDPRSHGYWTLMTSIPGQERGLKQYGIAHTVTVPWLIEITGVPGFDLVKLDVEGSEREVFTPVEGSGRDPGYTLSWLNHVQMALIATHEGLRRGGQEAVRQAFDLGRFSLELGGSHYVYRSKDVFDDDMVGVGAGGGGGGIAGEIAGGVAGAGEGVDVVLGVGGCGCREQAFAALKSMAGQPAEGAEEGSDAGADAGADR
ncbi:unnamed protein product [Closterium sp. NIES-54]